MIATILGQVTGQLEKRFILNSFFPALVFALAFGATVAAGFSGPLPAIEAWEGDSTGEKVLIVVAAVAGVFLFANLLSNGMQWVIKLFEGYKLPGWLAKPGRRRQLKHAKELVDKAHAGEAGSERAADGFQLTFPIHPTTLTPNDVLPTRLGNLIRSAESYPRQRYGVDSVRFWPRLSPLLPESILAAMTAARTSMEFLLAVSLLSGIYAPIGSIYLIVQNADLSLILIVLVLGSVISIATYFAALAPAAVYGEQIRTAFDLHRHDLLKQLGMPLPASVVEERRLWRELVRFLDRGESEERLRYVIRDDGS